MLYESEVTSAKLKISHILTKYEYECQDIEKKLKSGLNFSILAQKYSICSSAEQGGFLGEITLKRLDSDFAEAVSELSVGEVSGPVKTRFGYHLIRRES